MNVEECGCFHLHFGFTSARRATNEIMLLSNIVPPESHEDKQAANKKKVPGNKKEFYQAKASIMSFAGAPSVPFGQSRGTGASPLSSAELLKRKISDQLDDQKKSKKQKKKHVQQQQQQLQKQQQQHQLQQPAKYGDALSSASKAIIKLDNSAGPLPIAALRSQLVASIRNNATTIVVGETGSGKSTKLAQYLADDLLQQGKSGCIVCTQPRRVAAVTIAQRVAAERRGKVGDEVGYSIRFEDKTSKRTRIKFVTDGVLVRECMSDPDLSGYTVVILDEAHERSLQTDILMGLLRQLQDRRSNLRLVVMSATLQIDLFMGYFKDAQLVSIPGRQFPVDVLYTREPEPDFIDAAMLTCLQIHEHEEDGGVLVFLPGQDDIEALRGLLDEHLPNVVGHSSLHVHTNNNNEKTDRDGNKTSNHPVTTGILKDFDIRALYAAMPPEDQLRAFAPSERGVRKFILSTNIAETSVTISGIKYVIDCGFVKTRMIQPNTGIEMLKVMAVSKAQANQRAGRAGRESEGRCYRLFTEDSFEALEMVTAPEIQRVNVAQVVLQLKKMGIASPRDFPYVSPPSDAVLRKAFEMLLLLGALGKDQSLTPHGEKMAGLPLDPTFSHLLLKSYELRCVAEVVTAVSLLSSDAVFLQVWRCVG